MSAKKNALCEAVEILLEGFVGDGFDIMEVTQGKKSYNSVTLIACNEYGDKKEIIAYFNGTSLKSIEFV